MSSQTILVYIAAAALFAAGCGKKDAAQSGSAAPATTAAAAETPAAAPATAAGPRVLELTGNDTMKYAVPGGKPGEPVRLEAKAGETVRVLLRNTGNLPKEAMGHNFVLLKAGVNVEEFAAAAIAAGLAKEYFPADRADQTIAHTKLIGPKQKAEVTFTVPAEPGEYVFLCTFPGHLVTGMRGVLAVTK